MLENKENLYLEKLYRRYACLRNIENQIQEGYNLLKTCFINKRKLLVAGNGGSAADAEHIVGELMKSFYITRPISEELQKRFLEIDHEIGNNLQKNLQKVLPAIALNSLSLNSAIINDTGIANVFAQQVYGYGKRGDVFLAISTSGNSKNILHAAVTAKAIGVKVLGLTGKNGGKLGELADVVVQVPEEETYLIQELHIPIYHSWCLMLEEYFFSNNYSQ